MTHDTKKTDTTTPPASPAATPRTFFTNLLLSLAIAGCLVLGFFLAYTRQTVILLQEKIVDLQEEQTQASQNITQNQQNQATWQAQLSALSAKIAIPDHNENLSDWIQVRNSLQISTTNLLFLQDNQQALVWLTSARNLTNTIPSTNKQPILTSLDALIQAVQQLPKTNKSQAIDQLDALKKAIFTLEKDNLVAAESSKKTSPTPVATWQDWFSTEYWHNQLHLAIATLADNIFSSVSVQHIESIDQYQISALTLANLQTSSSMLIEQVQWGILYNNETIYQHALQQLQLALEQTAPVTEQRQNILDQISALRNTTVTTTYPDYTHVIGLVTQQIQEQTAASQSRSSLPPAPASSQTPSSASDTQPTEQTVPHSGTKPETPSPSLTIT